MRKVVVKETPEWKRLRREVLKMAARGPHVRVGVLAEKGGDEAHDQDSGLTLMELAAIHEFGSPAAGIPERSFIRRTFVEKSDELGQVAGKLAGLYLDGKLPLEKALGLLGAWGAAEVKKTVMTGPHIPPPLKPATVERKGSSRPLVDTGRLINSVQWQVEMKGGD